MHWLCDRIFCPAAPSLQTYVEQKAGTQTDCGEAAEYKDTIRLYESLGESYDRNKDDTDACSNSCKIQLISPTGRTLGQTCRSDLTCATGLTCINDVCASALPAKSKLDILIEQINAIFTPGTCYPQGSTPQTGKFCDTNTQLQQISALAEALADKVGVPFKRINIKVAPDSNLQSRARDARYEALRQAKDELGADYIITAHHADDRAETFLFRLIRGRGLGSLAVMPELNGFN